MKVAIITGITGQDGSYLADLLLKKGYEVHGIIRRVSTPNTSNIEHLLRGNWNIGNYTRGIFHHHEGDITDLSSLARIFKEVQPDEIYNLAAQTFVGISWNQPIHTCNTTGMGALNVFEAVRQMCSSAKIYQASSSEMFSGIEFPQNENTRFKPRSPYVVANLFAHESARIYRESYNQFISCGILFNHESPRRGIEFVTQKIVDTAVRQFVCGEDIVLKLGNIEASRDWSHAKDMVYGMWQMLQEEEPQDYVLASGKTHTVREFVEKVYEYFGVDFAWMDTGGLPEGYDCDTGNLIVESVPEFYRPNEVETLLGDSTKARTELKWEPKLTFDDLVADMVSSRIAMYQR